MASAGAARATLAPRIAHAGNKKDARCQVVPSAPLRSAPAERPRRAVLARVSTSPADTSPAEEDGEVYWRVVKVAFRMPGWQGDGKPVLVGSGDLLGDWDPELGLKVKDCIRKEGTADTWHGFVKVPAAAEGDYKVVITRPDAVDVWMPDDNQTLPEPTPGEPRFKAPAPGAPAAATDAEPQQFVQAYPMPKSTPVADAPVADESGTAANTIVPRRSAPNKAPKADDVESESAALAVPTQPDTPTSLGKAAAPKGVYMPVSVEDVCPSQGSSKGKIMATVVFRAKIHVTDQEEVTMVGSCEELGHWIPEKAAPMVWSEDDIWSAAVKLEAFHVFGGIDDSSPAPWIDFKPVVKNKNTGAVRWLDGDNCRLVRFDNETHSVDFMRQWVGGRNVVAETGYVSGDTVLPLDAASTDWARSVTVEIIGAGSYVPPGSRRSASTEDTPVPTRPAAAAAQHVEDIVSLMNEPEPALADVATNYVPEVEDTEDEEEAAALIDMPAPEPIAAVATPIVVPTPVMFDSETKAAVSRALRTVPFAAVAAPEPVKPKSRPKPVFTSDENVGTVIKRKRKTEKRKTKAQLKQEKKKKQGGFFGFFGKKKEDDEAAAMDKSMPTLDIGAIDVDLGNKAEYQGMLSRALRTAAFVTVGANPPFIAVEPEAPTEAAPADEPVVDPTDGRNVDGYVYARSSKLIRDDGSSTSNVVEFNVVSHLTVGEHLVLVGNVAELGGWKVDVGRRMTWSEGDVWKTSISIPNAEASAEFKFVRYNDNNGVLTWQEGDNYACELVSGEVVSVVEPHAFVERLTVEISAESEEATKARAAIAEAIALASEAETDSEETVLGDNENGTTEEEMRAKLAASEAIKAAEDDIYNTPVVFSFEDQPAKVDYLKSNIKAVAESVVEDEDLADEVANVAVTPAELAVVEVMKTAKSMFEEATTTAAAQVKKAEAAVAALKLKNIEDDESAYKAAEAEVEEESTRAFEAIETAKRAKMILAEATAKVAELAKEEADAAEEKAQAAADALADASGADILTQAELKKEEEATAAAAKKAAEKREKFEVEFDAVSNFEFPEFTVTDNQKKVAGAAIIGGLGAAGLVAEADVAQALLNVGGEAMTATAMAFLFANNMVFKQDRERLFDSLENKEKFEKFLMSGAWMGKDSFAGEVAADAFAIFDPLGLADDKPMKRDTKKEKEAIESASKQGFIEQKPKDLSNSVVPKAVEEEKPEADKPDVGGAMFSFGKPAEIPGKEEAEAAADAAAEQAKAAADYEEKAKGLVMPTAGNLNPPPMGRVGNVGFRKGAAGANFNNPNLYNTSTTGNFNAPKVYTPRRADVETARTSNSGQSYQTWMKKNKEDLSTLTWQELADRMKQPYKPEDGNGPR